MLATAEVRSLIQNSKIDRVLGGNLLPANNNASFLNLEDIYTVTVVDDSPTGATPVAFGLFNHCSPNQIYCAVITLKKGYEVNFIAIERVKNDMGVGDEHAARHACYRICRVEKEEENVSSLPQYFSAFAVRSVYPLHQCVVDALIDNTIGHVNMDMKRNITVDLYDTHSGRFAELPDELWRDRDGFIVTDRSRFAEIEISRASLLGILQKSKKDDSLIFETLNPKTSAAFLEYDAEICINDRSEYLEYLFSLTGVKGTVALDKSKRPAGYVLSLGNHVLQCYGDSVEIVNATLTKHVSQMIEPALSMFIRHDQTWVTNELISLASTSRRVRRFHSRIIPSQVKWNKIFALNMGLHLY